MGGSDIVKHKGGVLTNLFDFFPKIVYRTCLQNIQIFVEIYYNILVTKYFFQISRVDNSKTTPIKINIHIDATNVV